MVFRALCFAVIAILNVGSMTSIALSQEKSLAKKDVPKQILKAFQDSYPNATMKGFSEENEGGSIVYEIESIEGKIHRDVSYSANGSVISVEEAVAYKDLPEAVRVAVARDHPRGKVQTCEKILKGSVVQYELVVRDTTTKLELVYNPDGKRAETEKK